MSTINSNIQIIDQFKLLIKQIKFDIDFSSGKQQLIHTFRLRSIENVLKILEKYPKKIINADQLKNIKGVGDRSLKRINEILKTGKLSEVKITEDVSRYLNIIEKLEDVIGIGRKKAYELFKKYNITSVEDLNNKYAKGEIELAENIVKGLKYIGKIQDKIPRNEIDQLSEILTDITFEIDPKLFGVVCGSYRRQNMTSGDIDFIIVNTDSDENINYIQKIVTMLKQKKIIIDSLTSDNVKTKYMGICKLDDNPLRRIDIRYVPYESFYYAILYFTGSKNFNKKMRSIAIDMGYMLNEYGLYDKNGKSFVVNSEKEIFELLRMEYVTPDKRNE